ncbi:MAG TPA: hypothetical protein VH854_06875 [Thermoanaerobaculia bacterium]|jgi:hypothetical protein|nr:hypothetical protein [Thermoanaerobaculia bacterium]
MAGSTAAVRRSSGDAGPGNARLSREALRCRKKFLRIFPDGFRDETYLDWERDYKVAAHLRFCEDLGPSELRRLIAEGRHAEAASRAVRVEGRTHLLFSFEKMALRDAVRSPEGARAFAEGLFDFAYGRGARVDRFDRWCSVLGRLPRRSSRVLTWPVATVFGFLADPDEHFYFKPTVTRRAARAYGVELRYASRPSAEVYGGVLSFAETVRKDLRDLRPRDMIDIQSFLWVQGSDEYD